MMTVYLNREVDGCLDLYVTDGEVYRTSGSQFGYNSRDGWKILIGTFRENRDHHMTAEARAVQAVREWLAVYNHARIPAQYANEMVLPWERPEGAIEERPMKKQYRE